MDDLYMEMSDITTRTTLRHHMDVLEPEETPSPLKIQSLSRGQSSGVKRKVEEAGSGADEQRSDQMNSGAAKQIKGKDGTNLRARVLRSQSRQSLQSSSSILVDSDNLSSISGMDQTYANLSAFDSSDSSINENIDQVILARTRRRPQHPLKNLSLPKIPATKLKKAKVCNKKRLQEIEKSPVSPSVPLYGVHSEVDMADGTHSGVRTIIMGSSTDNIDFEAVKKMRHQSKNVASETLQALDTSCMSHSILSNKAQSDSNLEGNFKYSGMDSSVMESSSDNISYEAARKVRYRSKKRNIIFEELDPVSSGKMLSQNGSLTYTESVGSVGSPGDKLGDTTKRNASKKFRSFEQDSPHKLEKSLDSQNATSIEEFFEKARDGEIIRRKYIRKMPVLKLNLSSLIRKLGVDKSSFAIMENNKASLETLASVAEKSDAALETLALPVAEENDASIETLALPVAEENDASIETLALPVAEESDASIETLALPVAEENDASIETLAFPVAEENDASIETLALPVSEENDASIETLALLVAEESDASIETLALPFAEVSSNKGEMDPARQSPWEAFLLESMTPQMEKLNGNSQGRTSGTCDSTSGLHLKKLFLPPVNFRDIDKRDYIEQSHQSLLASFSSDGEDLEFNSCISATLCSLPSDEGEKSSEENSYTLRMSPISSPLVNHGVQFAQSPSHREESSSERASGCATVPTVGDSPRKSVALTPVRSLRKIVGSNFFLSPSKDSPKSVGGVQKNISFTFSQSKLVSPGFKNKKTTSPDKILLSSLSRKQSNMRNIVLTREQFQVHPEQALKAMHKTSPDQNVCVDGLAVKSLFDSVERMKGAGYPHFKEQEKLQSLDLHTHSQRKSLSDEDWDKISSSVTLMKEKANLESKGILVTTGYETYTDVMMTEVSDDVYSLGVRVTKDKCVSLKSSQRGDMTVFTQEKLMVEDTVGVLKGASEEEGIQQKGHLTRLGEDTFIARYDSSSKDEPDYCITQDSVIIKKDFLNEDNASATEGDTETDDFFLLPTTEIKMVHFGHSPSDGDNTLTKTKSTAHHLNIKEQVKDKASESDSSIPELQISAPSPRPGTSTSTLGTPSGSLAPSKIKPMTMKEFIQKLAVRPMPPPKLSDQEEAKPCLADLRVRSKTLKKKTQIAAVRKTKEKIKKPLPATLSKSITKEIFTNFAKCKVSKSGIEAVMKVSQEYWKNLSTDLTSIASARNGSEEILGRDMRLLLSRQGLITTRESLFALVEKYLPVEEWNTIIPTGFAKGNVFPPEKVIEDMFK